MSLSRTLLTAFIVAAAAVLFATWLTSGLLEPVGKSLFIGALVVVPFVVAAKNGIDGAGAFALAFVTYFAITFAVIWLVFRNRSVPRDGK